MLFSNINIDFDVTWDRSLCFITIKKMLHRSYRILEIFIILYLAHLFLVSQKFKFMIYKKLKFLECWTTKKLLLSILLINTDDNHLKIVIWENTTSSEQLKNCPYCHFQSASNVDSSSFITDNDPANFHRTFLQVEKVTKNIILIHYEQHSNLLISLYIDRFSSVFVIETLIYFHFDLVRSFRVTSRNSVLDHLFGFILDDFSSRILLSWDDAIQMLFPAPA